MEKQYDYSRHKFCITFTFENDTIKTESISIGDHFTSKDGQSNAISRTTSISCRTSMGNVESEENAPKKSKIPQEDIVYIRNVFSELNESYLRLGRDLLEHDAYHDIVLKEAVQILQREAASCKYTLRCSNTDFFYAFTTPRNWGFETREELIRPLFMKAGLIDKDDGQGRLIFFTVLESNFRFMQSDDEYVKHIQMQPGKQYIISTLQFQDEVNVDLELVSAQYPAIKVRDNNYVPQLLHHVNFSLPFDWKKVRCSLIAYLKNQYGIALSSEIIDMMFQDLYDYVENYRYKQSSLKIFLCKCFEKLIDKYSSVRYGLKRAEIDAIQSITIGDILEDSSKFCENVFIDQMNILLQGTNNMKAKTLVIFWSNFKSLNSDSQVLLTLFATWSKTYCEKQNIFYKLYSSDGTSIFSLKSISNTACGLSDLVRNQMQEYNMCRDPIIIPTDAESEGPKNSLGPVYFINIELSSTQIKAIITDVDDNGQIKRKESIDCNMRPLDNFFTQPALSQKPVLRIDYRLRQLLEKCFGNYLKMHSNPTRQPKPIKKQLKDIRDLFISKSNLIQQLTKYTIMGNFYMTNDKSRNARNTPVTISRPSYFLFFTITYLHTLKNLLEEKLKYNFGTDYQNKNIWYGVSVDKKLLDTVFGSTTKLEKLFFASGILRENDTRRKAKFCTLGEEILPAFQQKLNCLDFKMKSYFVVAQIFSEHLQLTLHQVVVLKTLGQDAATIIIQDNTLSIDGVYDVLYKEIWKSIQSDRQIKHCDTHKEKQFLQYDFNSLQEYKRIYKKLKLCVDELLEKNKICLDMDSTTLLRINEECSCSISISFRSVVEADLKSVVKNVTTIIAASLTNKEMFRNYEADFVFLFGNPFNLSPSSPIYTIYTMLLQKEIDDSINLKEKDTQAFVFKESVCQLMETITSTKPHMYNRFTIGTLCQVSSESYAIRFPVYESEKDKNFPSAKDLFSRMVYKVDRKDYDSFFHINCAADIKSIIPNDSNYLLIVKKGKRIPTKGSVIKFKEKGKSFSKAEIIKVTTSTAIKQRPNHPLIYTPSNDLEFLLYNKKGNTLISKLVIDCKRFNHNCSIEISVREIGHEIDYYPWRHKEFVNFGDPLAIAYLDTVKPFCDRRFEAKTVTLGHQLEFV